MRTNVNADDVGECPACGSRAVSVTALQLPASDGLNTGGCIVRAEAGNHFAKSTHPDYRPDVLIVGHGE